MPTTRNKTPAKGSKSKSPVTKPAVAKSKSPVTKSAVTTPARPIVRAKRTQPTSQVKTEPIKAQPKRKPPAKKSIERSESSEESEHEEEAPVIAKAGQKRKRPEPASKTNIAQSQAVP